MIAGILIILALLAPELTRALIITEIMYDLRSGSDSGREWVEVFNDGVALDLTLYKLVENGSQHAIVTEGSAILESGMYAVIADNPGKFKVDNPSYAGLLFDSAFSLNNDGESIAIADRAGNHLDSVRYTNASGNGTGDSLQRNSGANQFAAGMPTPGTGIPPSGLVQSAPPQQTSKKTSAAASAPAQKIEIVGESNPLPSSETFVAGVATSHTPLTPWFLATSLLAFLASLGLTYSRHLKKSEWVIVEETG